MIPLSHWNASDKHNFKSLHVHCAPEIILIEDPEYSDTADN